MKKIEIFKYQGAGNDFLIIDNRDNSIELSPEEIRFLCHRRFGIGADGLMYLGGSSSFDFSMRYFNSDGHEGTMCGNGGRCLVAFAARKGIKRYHFEAVDGEHFATISNRQAQTVTVELSMTDVTLIKELSPKIFFLDTGSPHLVVFADNLKEYNVIEQGRLWRNNPLFKGGTNVNFVQGNWGRDSSGWSSTLNPDNDFEISVRTYERGVEDETLACGTGVVASAIAYHRLLNKSVKERHFKPSFHFQSYNSRVKALGGDLNVKFNHSGGDNYTEILLVGPATFVFKCKIFRRIT